MVRVVAPAPFEAAPDAPACAVELTSHQPRSGSLPRDNIDQRVLRGEAGWQLNVNTPESRLSSLVSWRGGPPGARLPSMHHRRGTSSARCARSCTAPSRPHAPEAPLGSAPTCGRSQRCRSNDEIAVEQSAHSAPPTECADYLAEMWRGALERGGVPPTRTDDRRGRSSRRV